MGMGRFLRASMDDTSFVSVEALHYFSWFGHFERGLKELAPRNARFDPKSEKYVSL
jgi:hypothetical protein